ncbi:MAG TPA: transglycosylase domain-containing protein, partial [Anaerolineales bacterium]|nr:transglycosylase domain-containing protein [Anaerolineales bacterium]
NRFQRLANSEAELSNQEQNAMAEEENSVPDTSAPIQSEADAYFNEQDSQSFPENSQDEKPGEPPDGVEPDSASPSIESAQPGSQSAESSSPPNAVPPVDLSTQPMPLKDEEDTVPLGPGIPTTSHVPFGGSTPPSGMPALDKYGFPLPRRVDETDVNATRVSPAAYGPPPQRPRTAPRPPASVPPPPPVSIPPARSVPPRRRPRRQAGFDFSPNLGCLARSGLIAAFVFAVILLCGASFVIFQYYRIASDLPDINELRQKAAQFETTRILDRNGNVLYEILDPNAGRRTYVPLAEISPYLVAATIATEDKEFYDHPGFNILAIFRAFWQNYQGGEIVSGASTITQQLARALLFTPEERAEQSYDRKIREAVLAAEITRRYSKDDILELYLNEIYYGNLAYGVEAAAETYFGLRADQLTLGQASLLAGLPQAPSVYDVYTRPDLALQRHEAVLVLMYQASQEQGCIFVSNSPQRVCLDPVVVTQAADEMKNYTFNSPDIQIRYPHWVDYIRALLEQQFDAQIIYRSGFTVYTTLDPGLQDLAEQVVSGQIERLQENRASSGALVAVRPITGEILAMVGSADFYNEAISGQVNMAINPRQPGSSIKPLTYIAAFEKGWTPGTLIWDVPSEFPPLGLPNDPSPVYQPVNYDGRFHGPVTVRTALANSYNMPAVKTLNFVGIYDDPTTASADGFINLAKRMGITTLTRQDYGLSLTLGGGEVTLLELTNAYATIANYGRRVPPVAITRILDKAGEEVYRYNQPSGDQVIRPEHAYLISSILSDNEARSPAFGANSVLNLPFQAAVKTGTTNDFRDNWTLGYTPDLAVGVWVGNADYTPMVNTSGLTGAAPIWSEFIQTAVGQITGGNPTPFKRPGGIVDHVICAISGTLPSEWCPLQRTESFAADQPPLPREQDLWQRINLDTWTGLRASQDCSGFTEERFVLNVTDEFARQWLRRDAQGEAWAEAAGFGEGLAFTPPRECQAGDPRPILEISSPRPGETILNNPLVINGVANASQWFDFWQLDYGLGNEPVEWKTLQQSKSAFPQAGELFAWYMDDLIRDNISGPLTLRLRVNSTEDTHADLKITLNLSLPTPTPTATPTPTVTILPTVIPTATPTPTIMITREPRETETPTPTSLPDETTPIVPTP